MVPVDLHARGVGVEGGCELPPGGAALTTPLRGRRASSRRRPLGGSSSRTARSKCACLSATAAECCHGLPTEGVGASDADPKKPGSPLGKRAFTRVANGTRTRDHRDHNPGLYQLSYRHRAPLIVATAPPSQVQGRAAMRPGGFEPPTNGLEGRRSVPELRARAVRVPPRPAGDASAALSGLGAPRPPATFRAAPRSAAADHLQARRRPDRSGSRRRGRPWELRSAERPDGTLVGPRGESPCIYHRARDSAQRGQLVVWVGIPDDRYINDKSRCRPWTNSCMKGTTRSPYFDPARAARPARRRRLLEVKRCWRPALSACTDDLEPFADLLAHEQELRPAPRERDLELPALNLADVRLLGAQADHGGPDAGDEGCIRAAVRQHLHGAAARLAAEGAWKPACWKAQVLIAVEAQFRIHEVMARSGSTGCRGCARPHEQQLHQRHRPRPPR